MTKLSVGASVLLLIATIPAYAVTPVDVEPSRTEAPSEEPAAPASADPGDTGSDGGHVSADIREKELAELKAANAAQSEAARQQIEANARSREEADRAKAEYQRELDAVNAARAKYEAEMVIYNRRVAACEAGDRKGCLGE